MPRIVTDLVCPLSRPHYRTKPSLEAPLRIGGVRVPAAVDLRADCGICPHQATSRPQGMGPWLQLCPTGHLPSSDCLRHALTPARPRAFVGACYCNSLGAPRRLRRTACAPPAGPDRTRPTTLHPEGGPICAPPAGPDRTVARSGICAICDKTHCLRRRR